MYRIQNAFLTLSLDEKGRLVELYNHASGMHNVISHPRSLFHTILKNRTNWEEVAYADDAEFTVTTKEDQATIHVTALNTRQSHVEIDMTLTITLDGEKVLFDADIDNIGEATVTDFYYPCVGGIESLGAGAPSLLYPAGFGELHTDIIKKLRSMVGRDTVMLLSGIYPFTLSMQCMILCDAEYCLYLGAHDSQYHIHSLLAQGSEDNDVTLKMDKMIFVEPGTKWKNPQYTLWLYRGTWQQGAEFYREWADQASPVSRKNSWLEESNGILTAVGKQNLGAELWQYDQLGRLYEIAEQNGCDTLLLDGIFYTDHRDLLSDLIPISKTGGKEALKKSIEQIHKEKNGRVILHYPGHKMEMHSPHFSDIGERVVSRNHWGNPYHEQYTSPASTHYMQDFGERSSAVVCPCMKEWQDLMIQKVRQMRELGADGAIFDDVNAFQQYVHNLIAAMKPYPCFAPDHHHDHPTSAYAQGRYELLKALHEAGGESSDFALLCEGANDLFASCTDLVRGNRGHESKSERDSAHNGGASPDAKGRRAAALKASGSIALNMPEFYRHTFPEVLASVYNDSPYLHPRMVNYALCYGFRFNLSVQTQHDKLYVENNANKEWQSYAASVCALRKRHAKLLLGGNYSCDPTLTAANPTLHHGVFTSENESCIVLWNDNDSDMPIDLCGRTVSSWESMESRGKELPKTIAANSVLVIFTDADQKNN